MAQTRTALGTNSTKASGTSLAINNVTVPAGASLVVGVAYDGGQGEPIIKYGKKTLDRAVKHIHTTADFEVALYFARNIRKGTERDIVATWAGAIEARAMFASYLTEAGAEDVQSKEEQNSTTITTGANKPTLTANTFHIAALASRGPDTDAVGTASSGDTLGQTVGTSGGVATTNIFLRETYEDLVVIGDLRGRVIDATLRDNAGVGVAFKAWQTFTIKDVIQWHRDMNDTPDYVRVLIEDESNRGFWDVLLPEEFDGMSDAQFTEWVTRACARWSERILDNGSNVDEDSVRNTRMAGFVDDEIIL